MNTKKHLIISLILSALLGLLLFNMPTYALTTIMISQSLEQEHPNLYMPNEIIGAKGVTVTVPIELQSNGALISAMLFSVDYDTECLAFDEQDENEDRYPDGVKFYLPQDFSLTATHDIRDKGGEIDFIIADFHPPNAVLYNGLMALLTFEVICQPPPGETILAEIKFSTMPNPSFSSPDIRRVIAQTSSGSVRIYEQMPTGVPTATRITTPTMTPTPKPTSTPTSTPTHVIDNLTPIPTNTQQPTVSPTPSTFPSDSSIFELPIILQNGLDRVTSANFTVQFNSTLLEFMEIEFNIPPTMQKSVVQIDNSIQVALYTPAQSMPILTDGRIATIQLRFQQCLDVPIIADDLQLTDFSLGTVDGQSSPISKLTLLSSQLTNITCQSTTMLTTIPTLEATTTSISTPESTRAPTPFPTVDPAILIFSNEFDSTATRSSVKLHWHTTSETGVIGFHIWRGPSEDRRSADQITEQLIPGRGFGGGSYNFTVPDSDRENSYRYWLELVTEDGAKRDIAILFVPAYRETVFYLPIIQWLPKATN